MSRYTFADFLTSVSDPGTSRLSAINLANFLGIREEDLAAIAGVHRNTLHTHPESPRLQAALRDIVRTVSAAVRVEPDVERAMFLLKNHPIAVFHHKTILQLIQDGRTADAVDYLDSISGGFVG